MSTEIRIVDDPLAECAAIVSTALSNGPVVLTGGSTNQAYSALDADAWDRAQVWFSDERCVGPSDERSNYGALISAVGDKLVNANVHAIPAQEGYDLGALAYEHTLLEQGIKDTGFELFVIGLGPDTHICSMFPGFDAVDERSRLCVGVPIAGLDPKVPRVTLTFPAIALARQVLVMAAGAGKAEALAQAFAEDAPVSRDVPGSLLSEFAQEMVVLTDEEGASRL